MRCMRRKTSVEREVAGVVRRACQTRTKISSCVLYMYASLQAKVNHENVFYEVLQ